MPWAISPGGGYATWGPGLGLNKVIKMPMVGEVVMRSSQRCCICQDMLVASRRRDG